MAESASRTSEQRESPVYVLAQLTIHDPERYGRYVRGFSAVLAKYEGRLLVADDSVQVLEGTFDRDKVVLLRFADEHAFRAWSESPEYRSILVDRVAGASATVLRLRGVA